MAEFLAGWDLDLMQLDSGGFRGQHFIAGGGPVLLQEGHTHPTLIQRGACPPHPTFCLIARPGMDWVFRGRVVSTEQVHVVWPGEDLLVRSNPGFHVFTVSVKEDHLRRTARAMGLDSTVDAVARIPTIRPTDAALSELRRVLGQTAAGLAANRAAAAAGAWNARLDVDVVRVLLRTLSSGIESPELDTVRAWDLVVSGVESTLRNEPRHAFSVAELSTAVGVGEHTLRRAVRAWYGAAPKRIVQLRRLHGARRELIAARPHRVKVTRVALSWGFEHLGRFARDYRALFGESPSQTLARAS